MRSISIALAALLIALSLLQVSAQSPPPPPPGLTISPSAGGLTDDREVRGINFPISTTLPAVLIDPSGTEIPLHVQTGADGSFDLPLFLGTGTWSTGLYRVAVGTSDGRAVSTTFTASDGRQHLFAEPYLPSPTSAFNFVGTGLPAHTTLDIHLVLTGGNLGERDLAATTDASGSFSIYAWPEEMGTPFYPAGRYVVSLPQFGLDSAFWVREHPGGATIAVDSPVQIGQTTTVHFTYYAANHLVWGVYAGHDGNPAGEFLIGPTDNAGNASADITFPDLGQGPYYIATPYDWGETSFDVIEPTATPTATATATSTPSPTKTPSHKKCTKKQKKKGKKHCKL